MDELPDLVRSGDIQSVKCHRNLQFLMLISKTRYGNPFGFKPFNAFVLNADAYILNGDICI